MTLSFSNISAGAPENTPIYLDGDFSGWNSYRFQLISKYTNKDIAQEDVYEWTLELDLLDSNERYSHFDLNPFSGQGTNIKNQFKSGYYDFILYGTSLVLDKEDPWNANQWTPLLTGEVKVKTKTTHNMQTSQQAETVKYTTSPNTAQSYVIYQ